MDLSLLPNEILIEVFDYCKLTPLTTVCTRFNNIISSTPRLMRKFNLLISERSNLFEISKSKRRHQKILIKFNYHLDDRILDVLKTFSEQIKHLEIMRSILTSQLFIKMMELLPSLESLSIYATYLRNSPTLPNEISPICMDALNSLNFRNSDQKFLFFLKTSSSLRTINVSLPHQYPAYVITNFLENHRNVEIIDSIIISEMEQSILVALLCDMKNLRKLSLELDKLQMDDVRNLMISNHTVEFLNLYGSPSSPADFNIVINFFKKLKHLEIEVNSILEPINMIQLQKTAKQIESLKIMNCYGDYFNHIALPNLKAFEINSFISVLSLNDWTNFSIRNPNVEILIIKDEAIADDALFMRIVQEFKNLRHLELHYDPMRLTNEIINFICDSSFPRKIKTLKIKKPLQYSSSSFTLTNEHKELLSENLGFNLILR